MRSRSAILLIVEDNPADVELTRESLVEARLDHELHVAEDGESALGFLRCEGDHADAPRPDLVLLDLNLPRMTGHEVLDAIRQDPWLRAIPVIMLTSSEAAAEIRRSYELGANAFLTKPVDLDRFVAMLRALDAFWLETATLPRQV